MSNNRKYAANRCGKKKRFNTALKRKTENFCICVLAVSPIARQLSFVFSHLPTNGSASLRYPVAGSWVPFVSLCTKVYDVLRTIAERLKQLLSER